MKREWKPGDVAMVCDERGETRVAVRTNLIDARHHWAYDEVGIGRIVTDVRPLVVIDPEDREQVERLTGIYDESVIRMHNDPDPRDVTPEQRTTAMRTALREFANPTPPKPDEPQGLGAVVEDARGVIWVRADGGELPWLNAESSGSYWLSYADIAAVRVLSEGVS